MQYKQDKGNVLSQKIVEISVRSQGRASECHNYFMCLCFLLMFVFSTLVWQMH